MMGIVGRSGEEDWMNHMTVYMRFGFDEGIERN
jgi:hypothetical protein